MLLTDEFIKEYKDVKPPMTQLGEFVYYRTYSRYLQKEKRREYWWETVRRAVEYNCSLVPNVSKVEAEQLYHNIFYLKQFLSGRTLYTGGTEASKIYPSSNFNCASLVIKDIEAFHDMFYLLMLGCGVGFRVLPEDVEQLPEFNTHVKIVHMPYEEEEHKFEETGVLNKGDGIHEIVIGDSKNGWCSALKNTLDLLTKNETSEIRICYNNVRTKGTPLKTFGGTASGHEAIKDLLDKVSSIISKSNSKLTTLDCLDVCNLICEAVVVGGVRRSASICMFDVGDRDIRHAKNGIYYIDTEGKWHTDVNLLHRTKSNNSIMFYSKPSKEQLKEIFDSIKVSGEPGFFVAENALKRFPEFKGSNPCGETLLPDKGFCNLVTTNVLSFVRDGELDVKALLDAFVLIARANLRMASIDVELEEWDNNQKKYMILGCSMTGWQDAMSCVNYSKKQQAELLRTIKHNIVQDVNTYARELKVSEPRLITLLKPEGSLSLLPTVSAGMHHSFSPYYIRRVRINASDPLLKVCEELGYKTCNENGQDDTNCTTKVVEFYVKSPVNKTIDDISAIEQLEDYKMFMDNYVQQNASNTITVKDNEWDSVVDWVHENWDCIIGVTFLSHTSGFYPLMPYEKISEADYIELTKNTKQGITPELIAKYEKIFTEQELDSECTGGACPIR